MTILVIDRTGVVPFRLCIERQVSWVRQSIFPSFRLDRPKFIAETQIDVILKPWLACPVMFGGIERLHDVLLASLSVLRRGRQMLQMDEQVLSPVLQVLVLGRRVRVPPDPISDVLREPFVELIEVFRNNEPVMTDVSTVSNRERIGVARLVFNRKIGEIDWLILDCGGIALHGHFLSEDLNYMRASVGGRSELAARVQLALMLPTKKEAEQIVNVVIESLEATLLNNLAVDGFTLKLNSFGKFSVRHKRGILRKIPFSGKTILTKDKRKVRFVSLGSLRQCESVADK